MDEKWLWLGAGAAVLWYLSRQQASASSTNDIVPPFIGTVPNQPDFSVPSQYPAYPYPGSSLPTVISPGATTGMASPNGLPYPYKTYGPIGGETPPFNPNATPTITMTSGQLGPATSTSPTSMPGDQSTPGSTYTYPATTSSPAYFPMSGGPVSGIVIVPRSTGGRTPPNTTPGGDPGPSSHIVGSTPGGGTVYNRNVYTPGMSYEQQRSGMPRPPTTIPVQSSLYAQSPVTTPMARWSGTFGVLR